MTYSIKTLIIAAMLFISSMLIVGAMHLPFFKGADGFEAMESTFNSLRKGIKPPFKIIEAENKQFLGKNFNITLVFRDNDEARIATMMFLRNKLTVTPKGRKINIQGDLGYTLKFFMDDIHLLYFNRFDALERRYSMPAIQAMYYLNRILQKMSGAMASQKQDKAEMLINKIRQKLLIPAYNLREALPVSQTSGFAYLALGTIGILLFAVLWDMSNFFFFGTLASEDFMKSVRIRLGRELSDAQKDALAAKKKRAAKAKAAKKKKGDQGQKVKSTRTNKEALQKKPEPKLKQETAATAAKKAGKKEKSAPAQAAKPSPKKAAAPSGEQQAKKVLKKKTALQKSAAKPNPAEHAKKKAVKPAEPKKRPVKKDASGKPVKKTASAKKVKESTSQNKGKKVTTQQGRKKAATKPKPEPGQKQTKKPAAQPSATKPEKVKRAAKKEIKPDEQ
ncbi:hypothetical protein Desal_1141 [Maridesulfovibrio salexigens DSM 2638]|uniref:Uncharacterized protein n=2 Tax=Maridesulfovibrio salexigens TaxID=880 RepID=C6C141_MARSD|nr:hypothetical protein Desal_1141 [Maridesulfovibrio salexigens DSM 2638]